MTSSTPRMDKNRKLVLFCLISTAVFSLVFCEKWAASVVKNLDALVSSCVVVPCTFTYPSGQLSGSSLRGIWHRSTNKVDNIYNEDKTRILDSFKGRTRLVGSLGENNFTLEIMDVKDHDNGPFCFRIELVDKNNKATTDMFSYMDNCVTLKMLYTPPKPVLSHSKTAIQGNPYSISCSVRHTCSSHMPSITWSHGTKEDVTESHKDVSSGNWETFSLLTFTPEEKDDDADLTCTATFNGGQKSSTSLTLNVKRAQNNNHIIIPAAAAGGTAVIFGLFCIFMMKKYKNRIAELQQQEGSMWNRLSRMSRRFNSGGRATPGQMSP